MINPFKKIELHQVYGIQNDIPKYTYVDRQNLDERLKYLLKTQRHIVIHGASKQGKSSLRKKMIESSEEICIQCLPDKDAKEIIRDILRQLSYKIPIKQIQQIETVILGEINGKIANPLVGEVGGKGSLSDKNADTLETKPVEGFENDLNTLKEETQKIKKRIVLEDFHYLSEDARHHLAFYLKALYEYQIYVVIIGIWSEQNLLTYYNSDLSGRIEEIDLNWRNEELENVLEKGEDILRIKIDPNIKANIVKYSFNNVGLTQRLIEKFCFNSNIFERQPLFSKKILASDSFLEKAKSDLITDIRQRYIKIHDVFMNGFEETELKVYYNIFKAFTIIPTEDVVSGIHQSKLLEYVTKFNSKIRLSDLVAGLNRIERLQSKRDISPFLIMYNENTRETYLVDREFLFYREFGHPEWEWKTQ